MLIKIKEKNDGKEFNIRLPFSLMIGFLNLSLIFGKVKRKKHLKDNDLNEKMEIINFIDIKALKYGVKELKKYKGLKLVEVESKDAEVLIQI